jgi:hypothetical protein
MRTRLIHQRTAQKGAYRRQLLALLTFRRVLQPELMDLQPTRTLPAVEPASLVLSLCWVEKVHWPEAGGIAIGAEAVVSLRRCEASVTMALTLLVRMK